MISDVFTVINAFSPQGNVQVCTMAIGISSTAHKSHSPRSC